MIIIWCKVDPNVRSMRSIFRIAKKSATKRRTENSGLIKIILHESFIAEPHLAHLFQFASLLPIVQVDMIFAESESD